MNQFLECRQLYYRYPGQEQDLLKDLSFSVERGEFIGILGAEDSGKTTLAKILKGLALPTAGKLCLGKAGSPLLKLETSRRSRQTPLLGGVGGGLQSSGDDPPRLSPTPCPSREGNSTSGSEANICALSPETPPAELARYRRAFGAVFSDPEHQIVGSTVEEDVAFGLGNLQLPTPEIRVRTDRYLERFELSRYAKRAPHELSGGEQQKLCVAAILAMEPDCVIFDEPLTFLDRKSRLDLLQLFQDLNQHGKTIIYFTSDPDELLSANRILLLKDGQLVKETSIQQLWQQPDLLEEIDIMPPDLMLLRDGLRRSDYAIRIDSFTPEALVEDICKGKTR